MDIKFLIRIIIYKPFYFTNMNKTEIFEQLRKTTLIKSLKKLPDYLDVSSENGTLYITLNEKGLLGNMQTDASAFEGWAFAIKSICPELAGKVVIQWKSPKEGNLHYNRFLYRAVKFEDSYEWVEVSPLDEMAREDFNRIKNELGEWVINYPTSNAKDEAQKVEAQLERAILNHLSNDLRLTSGNQLPVGLFFKKRKATKENARTPSNLSQIDLWSLTDDTFTVYELKKDDNNKVGIISELMFYVNVIKDINEGIIKYPDKANSGERFRSFGNVLSNLPSNPKLKIAGVFLANNLHPLLTFSNKLMGLLNDNSRSIHYKQVRFKTGIILEPSNIN